MIGIERPTGDRPVARTCVWVERRASDGRPVTATADERQTDATGGGREADAPIIASVDGDEQSAAFTEMYRLAADNAAVARGLMQWRASRAPSIQQAD